MAIIQYHLESNHNWSDAKAQRALAAALIHDVGHGAFSHAFEAVGKRLNLKMANHELVSDALIRDSEITEALNQLGSGFASDAADIIKGDGESTLYSAVVSSQFDADRLDYMRRDRMMAGSNHGAIDFEWLVQNIEVGKVQVGTDEEATGSVETFVIGKKAVYAAEAYVIGLFHLYPAVYLHKTTRGIEKLFTELLCRIFELAANGNVKQTGLPSTHPLCKFAKKSNDIENVLALDDTVVWGALSMLSEARDATIADIAKRLRDRQLFKAIDIRERLRERIGEKDSGEVAEKLDKLTAQLSVDIESWKLTNEDEMPRLLLDQYKRSPYKQLDPSKGPINQIMVKDFNGDLVDLGKLSPAVSAIEPFRVFRVYVNSEDDIASEFLESWIKGAKIND